MSDLYQDKYQDKYQDFLHERLMSVIDAAMSRAMDSRQKGFLQFADLHRESAIGAYALWSAVAHGDYIKRYQEKLLDVIYK